MFWWFFTMSNWSRRFYIRWYIITLPQGGCKVLWWLCLSVCLTECITQKPHGRTSPNFSCMLPVAVAWSSSDGIVIFLYLQFYGWRHVLIPREEWLDGHRQNKVAGQTYKFDSVETANTECNVRQLQCLVEFITMRHRGEVFYLRLAWSMPCTSNSGLRDDWLTFDMSPYCGCTVVSGVVVVCNRSQMRTS